MKTNGTLPALRCRCIAPLGAAPFVPTTRGQTAPTAPAPDAATVAKYDKDKNGRLDPDELAALRADEAKAAKATVASTGLAQENGVVEMTPFEVGSAQDRGYLATNSMSGTRLNSKIEDLAASITIVTKQQPIDTAAGDINDVFAYEANTEGMRQYTPCSREGGDNESTTLNPVGIDSATIDRVRQLGGNGFAEVNTVTSTGHEFELVYNPASYWTMKVPAAEQKAVDSQLSQSMNQFFATNLAYLQGIKDPTTGGNWWTTTIGTSTTGALDTWDIANIATTLSQASVNAGKPRQQTQEWSFAGNTNFRLSGITDPDGVIRSLDRNRPIFDKARYTVDLLASCNLRLVNKVRTRLQLNVTNVLEDGRLQPIADNPDGQAWNYRIIDSRRFILTATFDL